MHKTKSTQTPTLAASAATGRLSNRQEPFGHKTSSIVALRLAVAVAILSMSASWTAYGQTIVSATISSQRKQITITGANLLPATGSPMVYLDGSLLTLVSSGSTEIIADLPAGLTAGSYRLEIGTSLFDVTNGAVGPRGATGAAGPQGATGATVRLARPGR